MLFQFFDTISRRTKTRLKKTSNRKAYRKRALSIEHLDSRVAMAGDLMSSFQELSPLVETNSSIVASGQPTTSLGGFNSPSSAEGEAAPDLVAFAKALSAAGLTLFGVDWAPEVVSQLRIFEDGAQYLNYVEVSNGDRTLNSIGQAQNITDVPTWQTATGNRGLGFFTLAELSTALGIPIPQSSIPSMFPIPTQTVRQGSPIHIPVDAYDPNGNPLTITVTSSNPSNVTAQVLQNNQSARITTNGYGEMVFQLFNSEAPRPVGRFVSLAQSGFYNTTPSNAMTFHRTAADFVIQGGDPLGTGLGGSTLGDFDDQFNLHLQHNRSGVLSYAKSVDDTNDSQFFVTAQATRGLDYNHSVFGQLIEGDRTRAGINRTAVFNTVTNQPVFQIVIQSIEIFNDTENGLLRLIATGAAGSTSDITVTVTDTEGNQVTQIFTVTVASDNSNGSPFLEDIPSIRAFANQPLNLQLNSFDEESDLPWYAALQVSASPPIQVNVNENTGAIAIQPDAGFVGHTQLMVYVARQPLSNDTLADPSNTYLYDSQLVNIEFIAPFEFSIAPTIIFEKDGVATGTVKRPNFNLSVSMEITLTNSDPTRASIPSTVAIPANQTTATFSIAAIDNAAIEGPTRITVTGQALNSSLTISMDIIDDDSVSPWHNVLLPADVDSDGVLSPPDVLVVINQLRRGGGLLPIPTQPVTRFVDTDGDFFLSPVDVLRVINAMKRQGSGEGEGKIATADSSLVESSALSLWIADEAHTLRNRRASCRTF